MSDKIDRTILPTIASPCVRNCCLNEEDICLGCFRSLNEIVGWYEAGNAARHIILLDAEQRKKDYMQSRILGG